MAFKLKKKNEINMLSGPILPRVLEFAFPLMLTSILQLFYNAADTVVVGRFAGPDALAAVGSTGSLSGLLIHLFMGMGTGTSVVTARFFGGKREEDVRQTVHTSISLALICGAFVTVVGLIFSPMMLRWMDTPADILPMSILYLQIYFLGTIANMVYNFGAGILRAIGDTKRPLYFLTISGVVNVVLNLILVIVFHLNVAGVAIATVVSQVLSAVLVVGCLARSKGCYRLDLKALRLYRDKVFEIMRVGIPAGLQSTMFSISNVLIQSSINSFGSVVMAANSASQNLGGFVNASVNVFSQACTTFASQNLGAKNYKRLDPILATCCGCIMVVGLIMSLVMLTFGERLLGIYTTDPEVIATGMIRIRTVPCLYFLLAVTNAMGGFLQAIGYNMVSTGVSMAGICGLRVAWVTFIWPLNPTLPWLYMSYPASWIVTGTIMFTCTRLAKRHLFRKAGVQ